MKKLIVGTTLMVLVLLAANAAAEDANFKGFYVGGYAGVAIGRSQPAVFTPDVGGYFASSSVSAINLAGNQQSLNDNVFTGGGQVGYNFQSEEGLVFGLEADF